MEKIEKGHRVGQLTVVEDAGERRNGYRVWRCACDCGGEILLDTRCLQRKSVRDCGCRKEPGPRMRDLTGLKFGRLTVLEPTEQRGSQGGIVWRCRCDCGGETFAVGTQLTQGYKKSCGCLSRPQRRDLVGQRFGGLTVVAYEGKSGGVHRWKCRCNCGAETTVGQTNLLSGKTQSCGCRRREMFRGNMKFVDGTSVSALEAGKRRLIGTNTSGCTGVYRNTQGTWSAQITFKGKTYFLGSYPEIEDAIRARREGEELHEAFLESYYAGDS